MQRTTERLSSGLKINSLADDPAGTGIAAIQEKYIRGGKAAIWNMNQGMALVNAVDGGASAIGDMLMRAKELATQANNANGLSANQRTALDNEYQGILTSINSVADNAQFNGVKVLTAGQKVTI